MKKDKSNATMKSQFMKKDEWHEYVNNRFMKEDKSNATNYKSIHEKRWKWQVNRI